MNSIAKFVAFLLRKYKGAAVYIVGTGIIFGVFAFFLIMDLFFRPWSLDPLAYDIIFVTLFSAGILLLIGSFLRHISSKRQNSSYVKKQKEV